MTRTSARSATPLLSTLSSCIDRPSSGCPISKGSITRRSLSHGLHEAVYSALTRGQRHVRALFARLRKRPNRVRTWNRDEILWISNALNEVLNGPEAIEEWEFHTRMGGDRDQVKALLRRVNDQVGALRRADPEW